MGVGRFIIECILYVVGLVKDLYGSYVIAFYVGAVGTFVGGAVMVAGNVWHYRRDREGYQMLE